MNSLFPIKDFCFPKGAVKENSVRSEMWQKPSNLTGKMGDFRKILKQRDMQKSPLKISKKSSQLASKNKTQVDNKEKPKAYDREKSSQEDTLAVSVCEGPRDKNKATETQVGAWEMNVSAQNLENFSMESFHYACDTLQQDDYFFAIDSTLFTENKLDDNETIKYSSDLPIFAANEISEFADEEIVDPLTSDVVDETSMSLRKNEVLVDNVKTKEKIPSFLKNQKTATSMPVVGQHSNYPASESDQNLNDILNIQHRDIKGWVGIKSALKGSDRKDEIVSLHTNIVTAADNLSAQDPINASNGSKAAEILSQKSEVSSADDKDRNFENNENILPMIQHKSMITKYETVEQNSIENIQGMIATLEQQMETLKRTKRNSVILKVDLVNGESFNCQVTLSHAEIAIRFPALEENFKAQILNHWESLKQFAQKHQLRLSDPHFNAQIQL